LGGGYEYNLNWLPGLFWKTEYRLAQYETDSLPLLVYGTGASTTLSIDSRKYVQTIRSELVWRFNWGR
jgi:outer membrane immunogenic protein